MSLQDLGLEVRCLATAHSADEVREMVLRLALESADEIALGIVEVCVCDDALWTSSVSS